MSIVDLPPTWQRPGEAYLLEVESRSSASNRRFRESRLTAVAKGAGERGIELAEYRKSDLQQFLIARSKQGISENTRYHDYQTAKMFFTFAEENGFVTSNPLAKFKVKSPAEVEGSRPTLEHLRDLLQAVRNRNDPKINDRVENQSPKVHRYLMLRETAIIRLLVDSGARVGSVLAMDVGDYQPTELQITLRKMKNKKIGYSPISPSTRQAIDAYLTERPQVESNVLFVSLLGDRLDSAHYGKVFARYVEFAGIPKITLHSLRRYCLTEVAREDFWSAVAIGHHQDSRTTQRYAKHVAEHVRAAHTAAAPLERVLGVDPVKAEAPKKRRVIR